MSFKSLISWRPWHQRDKLRREVQQLRTIVHQQSNTLALYQEDRGPGAPAADQNFSGPEGAIFLRMRLAETELLGGKQFTPETYTLGAHESGAVLTERIAELELALEDRSWLRMAAETNREFSRQGLRTIMMLARFFFLKNPLVRHGVLVQSHYVWAQGVDISARDELVNAVLQDFMDDLANQTELFSHSARTLKEQELQVTGNLFFVFFVNQSDGHVRLRSIPADEMQVIYTNPEDAKEPWFYERTWTPAGVDVTTGAPQVYPGRTVLYPDWRYQPKTRPEKFGEREVLWDSPIYHVKVGGLADMRFGAPEFYCALDWARSYSDFLQNACSIMASRRRYAWSLTIKQGGEQAVISAKAKMGTTAATSETQSYDTNPPPVAASTFIGTDGVKLEQFRDNGVNMEQGRRISLQVGAGMGLPETMLLGDVAKGAHATAKTLDRPTELKMRDRQELWSDIFEDIFNFVIDWAARAPNGVLHGQIQIDQKPQSLLARINAAKQKGKGLNEAGFLGGDKPARRHASGDLRNEVRLALLTEGQDSNQVVNSDEDEKAIDRHIDVDFPAILQQDVTDRINAIVQAATLGGYEMAGTIPEVKAVSRLLLQALGQDDIDDLLAEWFPTDDAQDATEEGHRLMAALDKLSKAVGAPLAA